MSNLMTCKPWCTDHQGANECFTTMVVWDNGIDKKPTYAEGSRAAEFHALAELPKDVAWIRLTASQEDDDAQPYMDLQFYEAENDEPVASVHLGTDGLKEIHSNIAVALKKFV